MKPKHILITSILGITIYISSMGIAYAQGINYTVQKGDTYWIVSQKFGVSLSSLMEANNANGNAMLYVGQNLIIPTSNSTQKTYTVQKGDTYWIISQKYGIDIRTLMTANNATEKTILNIGDKIIIPSQTTATKETIYTVQAGDTYWIISQKFHADIYKLMAYNGHNQNTILYIGQKIIIPDTLLNTSNNYSPSSKPYVTYISYTVQKGDSVWDLAIKFGIPQDELLKVNNIQQNTILYIGDVIQIPVHHVPIKNTIGEKYGEYLDWWTEAQYVIPVGATFKIIDFYTGNSFIAKRTTGANHADVETLTLNDTTKMKSIWGGSFSWVKRPIIIEYNGRKIASSAAGMPHAGNDKDPGGRYTAWRSGDYGTGYNLDWVKNNGVDGVFDVHFANSTTHKDGMIDSAHQQNIKIAAGIK